MRQTLNPNHQCPKPLNPNALTDCRCGALRAHRTTARADSRRRRLRRRRDGCAGRADLLQRSATCRAGCNANAAQRNVSRLLQRSAAQCNVSQPTEAAERTARCNATKHVATCTPCFDGLRADETDGAVCACGRVPHGTRMPQTGRNPGESHAPMWAWASPVRSQMRQGRASPVLLQMWEGRAQSPCRRGSGARVPMPPTWCPSRRRSSCSETRWFASGTSLRVTATAAAAARSERAPAAHPPDTSTQDSAPQRIQRPESTLSTAGAA